MLRTVDFYLALLVTYGPSLTNYAYIIPLFAVLNRLGSDSKRTFVQFILEPLYKIYSHVLGSEGKALQAMLTEIGVVRNSAFPVFSKNFYSSFYC